MLSYVINTLLHNLSVTTVPCAPPPTFLPPLLIPTPIFRVVREIPVLQRVAPLLARVQHTSYCPVVTRYRPLKPAVDFLLFAKRLHDPVTLPSRCHVGRPQVRGCGLLCLAEAEDIPSAVCLFLHPRGTFGKF